MPTVGTKRMFKVKRLTEEKNIFLDLSVFFHNVFETASVELDGSSKCVKSLPEQLKLSIKGVNKMRYLIDEAITFDGIIRLVHCLL